MRRVLPHEATRLRKNSMAAFQLMAFGGNMEDPARPPALILVSSKIRVAQA